MSSAPNFGFALAARKTDAAAAKELSLSHVRILMDAAEPVREANVRAFLARFQPAGITPGVYTPGYGLAEHGAWFGPSRSTCASIRCNLKGGFDPQARVFPRVDAAVRHCDGLTGSVACPVIFVSGKRKTTAGPNAPTVLALVKADLEVDNKVREREWSWWCASTTWGDE